MKKLLFILLTLVMYTSIFAQVQYVDSSELVKTLEKNRKTDITFETELNLNNLVWDNEGNLKLSTVSSEKYSLVAEIETELLRERLNYKNLSKYKVSFQLKSNKPKVYAVTKIEGIESVAEYKARIEAERLARLEAERIAEEKRLEEERLAEEARLEAERIAEEKRLEEERLAEEARLEAERIAEEKRLEEERLAEEARLEAERIAEEKRLEEERIAEEKRQRNAQFLPTYEGHLAKAKKYETEKRWCYALGSYYDAMGTVGLDPEYKTEAVNGYNALKDSILSGKPGFGTFNEFSLHDEWKKLLIDAEKYGSSFNPYEVTVGRLVRESLDYTTKTASYSADISYSVGNRYNSTIKIIDQGYEKSYREDWKDLPKYWPTYSASYNNDGVYNVNGAYIFRTDEYNLYGKVIGYNYHNAFGINDFLYQVDVMSPYGFKSENILYLRIKTLIDCKFNIVDENGKELVKSKRCLLGMEGRITFEGVPADVMDLIANGKAFVNPVTCYLEYGKFIIEDAKGGRSFIKNFPEVQLPMDKSVFICWNNKFDKTYDSFQKARMQKLLTVDMENLMIKIPEQNFEMSKTEVTQDLYETIMEENPSKFKGLQNPVEMVSWYDAIWFCNKLSVAKGYEPVYSVNGNTNIKEWNYKPHNGNSINGKITQNTSANGYRLPTVEEWKYAAKGGQDYTYAGSNEINEVAWYSENSYEKTHPVAQKKENEYGLYDMTGNVWEWCWDSRDGNRYSRGGGWGNSSDKCKVSISNYDYAYSQYSNFGFRIVCTVTE